MMKQGVAEKSVTSFLKEWNEKETGYGTLKKEWRIG